MNIGPYVDILNAYFAADSVSTEMLEECDSNNTRIRRQPIDNLMQRIVTITKPEAIKYLTQI